MLLGGIDFMLQYYLFSVVIFIVSYKIKNFVYEKQAKKFGYLKKMKEKLEDGVFFNMLPANAKADLFKESITDKIISVIANIAPILIVAIIPIINNFETLKQCICDRVEIKEEEKIDNLPFLWRYGGCYVVTFPYGVSRQYLCELADDIWVFCSCTVQAWCKPELFKKHTGNWLYLCFGQEDLLVAVAEDNSQWDINPDDAMLHKINRYDRSFKPYPTLDYSLMERIQY